MRWTKPLTLVVAGPGFGKSTALAQAVRGHALEPAGVEGWVACHPGHEQAEDLAAALLGALGCVPRCEDPLTDVLEALRHHSPLDVCVILDDVHEIPAGSSSARLLGDIVRGLPANAHLVLAGRSVPALPLARLRAADRLGEITQRDLVFTPSEGARLAARLGCGTRDADRFGGWPALVRLALAVGDDTSVDYLREEVLGRLPLADRRSLFGLVTVGVADAALVARITGAPVDLRALADRVPLVARVDDTHFRAHDLWLDPLLHVLDREEVRELKVRSVDELIDRGDLARAGALAVTHADWDALARVALELVRTSISVLPVDTASRWLDRVPPSRSSAPELRLLSAAVRLARDFADVSVDALVDEVAGACRARHDADAEVVALALGTVAAQSRGDIGRLLSMAARTTGVPGADGHPVVRLAARGIAAVVAEMGGDPEAALEEFAGAPLDDVPAPLALAAHRFRVHCLLLAGRADEAVDAAERSIATGGNRHSRLMPAFARWSSGDPSGFLGAGRVDSFDDYAQPIPGANSRDAFVTEACQVVMLSSCGHRARSEHVSSPDLAAGRFDNPRDAALVTNARAARALLAHDEATAASAFDDYVSRHPVTDELGQHHLRRFLALGYVLKPELRTAWDRACLGPSHVRARGVARALLAARGGRRPPCDADPLSPPVVFTVLPLPWSVELACRLHGLGSDDGQRLAGWLVDRVGGPARDELRHVAAGKRARLAREAGALLARLPIEPAERLDIAVLGPLELRRDGRRTDPPELRRARVRELLSVLVVEPNLPRDRAVALLWPELDAEAGGRNLRVTLAHLRRLLEPERSSGEAGFHLRSDSATIRLFPSPKLAVDLWELRRLVTEASGARHEGDTAGAIELLDEATSRWRGAPLTDLDRIAGLEPAIEEIRLLQLSSLLALGELQLTQGAAEALTSAERALAVDPYLEQAHRLAIAASVQRHDPARIRAAVARTARALDDLGVAAEPATLMLMRQAAAQVGRQTRSEDPLALRVS
jgi:LuxR family transcriptional regulator, maltose regulon positive regulatory protein